MRRIKRLPGRKRVWLDAFRLEGAELGEEPKVSEGLCILMDNTRHDESS